MTAAVLRGALRVLLVVLCWMAVPPVARAQSIVLEADADTEAVRVLEGILERGRYLLLDRDTLLPPDFNADGDVVVWDALVRLEGEVEGSVAVIRGTLAVRPGARVAGRIAALDGLVLASGLAEMGPVVELPAGWRVRVDREAGRLRVAVGGPPREPRLGLGGLYGIRGLTFDRVDGWSLRWGPVWRITGHEHGPRADAWVTLHSARRRPGGGGRLAVPLARGFAASTGAERATLSNERWSRSDVHNSAEAFLFGRDVRDYYESDRVWLRLGRDAGRPFGLAPYVQLSRSADRSLTPRRPWAVTARDRLERPTLAVSGRPIDALEAGSGAAWQGNSARLDARAAVEFLREADGGATVSRWTAHGRWSMDALWGHTLTVGGDATGTFGDRTAPPQRWSFVGGAATLPTLPVAARRGDHLVLLRTAYRAPVPVVELPLLGFPTLELLHAAGTAWPTGSAMPDWEQNLGLGIAFSFLRARAWTDPAADRLRPVVLLEAALR